MLELKKKLNKVLKNKGAYNNYDFVKELNKKDKKLKKQAGNADPKKEGEDSEDEVEISDVHSI